MIDLLTDPATALYAWALAFVLAVFVVELVGALVAGAGLGTLLDQLFEHDIDLDGEPGPASDLLGLGRVPVLVLALIYSCFFGLSGLLYQTKLGWFGHAAALPVAAAGAFLFGRPLVVLWARLFPKVHGEAVSERWYLTAAGEVTLGPISVEQVGEVALTDPAGRRHKILALAYPGERAPIPRGRKVAVIDRIGTRYRVSALPE
jgi:hypothetical protein